VKLQEQPFQVLVALLQRPGELVTREELRTKLWPADTFVDFDHSLNAAVKRLRDALGDSADAPVFVETLARRGYRFIWLDRRLHLRQAMLQLSLPRSAVRLSFRNVGLLRSSRFVVVGLLAWVARRFRRGQPR